MNPDTDIFQYLNYRMFMKKYYEIQKKTDSGFSYQLWADTANFSSPSFIKLVIEGKKNLSRDSILKIAKSMKLKKKSTDYFEQLVLFCQEKSLDEKFNLLQIVEKIRLKNQPYAFSIKDYDYLKKWYHCVIRELVELPDFIENNSWIAQKFIFPLKVETVKKSLEFLQEAGFINRNEEGKLKKREKTLSAGLIDEKEFVATIAKNYHLSMLQLARKALEKLPNESRNITNTTLSLSREGYLSAIKKIEQFRYDLLELAASDQSLKNIYQLNINMFQITQSQ